MDDGRLDEAYEIVQDSQVRQHRKGQQLVGRLVGAFIERGKEHLAGQRLQQGLADCSKAEKLGGNVSEIAELRSSLCQSISEKNQQDHQQSIKLAQARQHIEQGWPSAAEQVLAEGTDQNNEADLVLQQVAARRMEIDFLVNKAQESINQGDIEAAIDLIVKAPPAQRQSKKITDLVGQIKNTSISRIRDFIVKGRIDLAQALLERLSPLTPTTLEMQELEQVLSQCRRARQLLDEGQPRLAASVLQQIKSILPKVAWLDEAIAGTTQAAESLDSLRIGPLGLVMSAEYWSCEGNLDKKQQTSPKPVEAPADKKPAPTAGLQPIPGQAMPARFVVQVDGVGSFMVLREPSITLGPISSSRQPTLGLVADPNLPVATIERAEEDYFIRAEEPVYINDKPLTERLLVNGDRIAFSTRCGMKFHLPNAASSTAALTFTGARLPRADMRQAILMDREIIIGPGSSSHIRSARSAEKAVLFLRDGRIYCRSQEPVSIDGRPADENTPLPLETGVKIGRISLVLTKM